MDLLIFIAGMLQFYIREGIKGLEERRQAEFDRVSFASASQPPERPADIIERFWQVGGLTCERPKKVVPMEGIDNFRLR
jgi:hypothetical protein